MSSRAGQPISKTHLGAHEEEQMNWTHQHDPVGVSDYPNELSFEIHIRDYWTNESGTRIGFFGHAKGLAEFTYRKGDLNFKFSVHRASGQGAVLDRDDRTLGPICTAILDRSRQRLVDGETVTDTRKDLLEGRPPSRYPE